MRLNLLVLATLFALPLLPFQVSAQTAVPSVSPNTPATQRQAVPAQRPNARPTIQQPRPPAPQRATPGIQRRTAQERLEAYERGSGRSTRPTGIYTRRLPTVPYN